MISYEDVDKLRGMRAPGLTVLSLYLAVPLDPAARTRWHVPLVIGGHRGSITGLLQALPSTVRETFAGSFTADPHTLTPARVRELASP